MDAQRIKSILHTLNRFAEQKGDLLLGHLVNDLKSAIEDDEVGGLSHKERGLVESGRVIDAIRAMRARFLGTSDPRGTLKGAKDVVEAYQAKHHPRPTAE